jgi:competence protein ComEC
MALNATWYKGRWRWILSGALLAVALVSGVNDARPSPADGRLTAWVLDVGQGTSTMVRLPQGQVVLVDAGGGYGELDFGQRVIAPFLWSQGLKRVDLLVASHPHPDHVGGLPFLARWLDPQAIWTNGRGEERGAYGAMLAGARERGVAVRGPEAITREMELGGAKLRLIWPPDAPPRFKLSENDASLWLGIGTDQTWLWLPGDAGPRVERTVLPSLPEGGANVLVAPHHGGKGSCSAELLARLKPQAVVISAGCANRFGMPRADTMERIAAAGARTWLTATRGAVKLTGEGGTWRVEPYLSPARPCPLPEGVQPEEGLE